MNITEKSKEYAKGKAFEAMTAAIEKAYADGYNDGMQHRENLILESIEDGVEYVDLQLPSGKMWSSSYVKDEDSLRLLPYIEASKLHIPTEKDLQELFLYCAIDYYTTKNLKGLKFTGRNGRDIIIPYYKKDDREKECCFNFWIIDDDDSEEKNCASSYYKEGFVWKIDKFYMGYKLPIMLVKEVSNI